MEYVQLVNLGRRSACHLGEYEPSDNHSYSTRSSEANEREESIVNICLCLEKCNRSAFTYKNPVLTPHLVTVPLIIRGVQKLNMVATPLDNASDQPVVLARRRCWGISAA